eukprot:scaffold3315_cov236-Skeletonema_menzelii.AAC.1
MGRQPKSTTTFGVLYVAQTDGSIVKQRRATVHTSSSDDYGNEAWKMNQTLLSGLFSSCVVPSFLVVE